MATTEDNTIYLGLCMAGAVSAGAYTAGVMDYLLEALDTWEERKKTDPENTPSHQVMIPVIGGASAGGMTSILSASAIKNKIEPIRKIEGSLMDPRPENKFYHTWVDLEQDDMFPMMLDCGDISKGKVYSLLNSDFIDRLAERVVKPSQFPVKKRRYIPDQLKLFVTLSNLKGFSYNVRFQGNDPDKSGYIIKRHADFACFTMSKNGETAKYDNDGWIPLCFDKSINTQLARDAAMATGAFPVGLKSRKVIRKRQFVEDLVWSHLGKNFRYSPQDDPYETLNVDGGLINNEPFERVHELLQKQLEKEGERKGLSEAKVKAKSIQDFRTTLLMIDPFPSEEDKKAVNNTGQQDSDQYLANVIGKTFSAMTGQLRVKTQAVLDAFNTGEGSHFLIAPTRKISYKNEQGLIVNERKSGSEAIACGAMGGFSGFLHKEFRIHDYFLGRANCEWFLRNHFTIPLDKPHAVLTNGYKQLSSKQKAKFIGKNSEDRQALQIIPIFDDRKEDFYMPKFASKEDWPRRKKEDIARFKKLVQKRVGSMLMNIADLNFFDNILLWAGKTVFLRRKLTRLAMDYIEGNIKKHHLYEEE